MQTSKWELGQCLEIFHGNMQDCIFFFFILLKSEVRIVLETLRELEHNVSQRDKLLPIN